MYIFLLLWILLVIALLVTRAVPMGAIGVATILMLVATKALPANEAFGYIVSSNSIMIVSVLIMGKAIFTTGAGEMIGNFVKKSVSKNNYERKIYSIVMGTGLLASCFLPNTATTAAMLPAEDAISRSTGVSKKRLYIITAIVTNLGGMITLIGTTSNIIANSVLQSAGLEPFKFFDFAYIGLPVAIICVIFLIVLGKRFLPKDIDAVVVHEETEETTKIKVTKKQTAVLLLFLIFICSVVFERFTGIPSHLVGAAIATAMVVLRFIDEKSAVLAMDFGTTVFIASCLAYSSAFESTGSAAFLSAFIAELLPSGASPFIFYSIIFWFGCLISQVMSNTAATGIVVPLVITIAGQFGADPRAIVMVALTGCNCSYLTPMASPPNILVSAQSGLSFSDWLRIGVPLTAVVYFATVMIAPSIIPLL